VHQRSDTAETDAQLIELGASLQTELERANEEIPDAEEVTPETSGDTYARAAAYDASVQPAIPALGLSI
jgi:hypothetical protein